LRKEEAGGGRRDEGAGGGRKEEKEGGGKSQEQKKKKGTYGVRKEITAAGSFRTQK
jgi:hypothetical protein